MELNKIIRSVLFLTAGVVLTSCIEVNGSGPLFVIDNSVYHTDNYQTYGEQFYKSLTGSDSEDRKTNSFHYFRNGKYICSYDSI